MNIRILQRFRWWCENRCTKCGLMKIDMGNDSFCPKCDLKGYRVDENGKWHK